MIETFFFLNDSAPIENQSKWVVENDCKDINGLIERSYLYTLLYYEFFFFHCFPVSFSVCIDHQFFTALVSCHLLFATSLY